MLLEINGNTLVVDVQGDPDADVLIALHGGPGVGDRGDLTDAFSAFADQYRVITFDARGSGASGDVPPFTHEQWTADVDALRAWAGVEQIVLAGHSYGGMVAMEYATRYPQRVRALILVDTAAADTFKENSRARAQESDRVDLDMELFDRLWTGQVRDDEEFREGWRSLLPLYNVIEDPELVETIVNRTSYHYQTHNYAFGVNLPDYDVTDQLPSIGCPTLVMVGRYDWITPVTEAEKIAAAVPGAELVVFGSSGHGPLHEERELWVATVRAFLATTRVSV